MNIAKPINQSKVVSMLKSFSKKEIGLFHSFLQRENSDASNTGQLIFNFLKNFYPRFATEISKKMLYNAAFPSSLKDENSELTFSQDKQLRYELNYLSKRMQDFILAKHFEKQNVFRQNTLNRIYLDRGLYKLVEVSLNQTVKLQQKQRHKDPDYYYQEYLKEEAGFHYNLITDNRGKNVGIQEVIHSFNQYFIVNQLRYFCAAINRENILQVTYKYPMLNGILAHVKEEGYDEYPLIQVYYYILILLTEKQSDKHYQTLLSLITSKSELFAPEELQQIYAFALNFCTAKIKQGHFHYRVEKQRIYEITIPNGTWYAGRYLIPHHYIMAIRNSIVLKNFDWVEKLTAEFSQELSPNYKKSLTELSKAYLKFYKKDLEGAHNHLLEIGPPEDFFYELYYRILLIQLYFEKSVAQKSDKYENLISSALEALRFYISPSRNENMSEKNRLAYANFVKLTKRLFRVRFPQWIDKFSLPQLEKLKIDIEKSHYLEEREWLRDKVMSFQLDD